MKVCRYCRVTGRVQGVFFRASTRQQASAMGVTGWARNCSDGSVEVLCCGEDTAVAKLVAWLSHGPAAARVSNVSCETRDYEECDGFGTG